MAFQIPSIQDTYNKIKSSVFSYTQGQLEVEKAPFSRSFAKAIATLTNSCYKTSQDSIDQTFSQTVTDERFLNGIAFDRTRNTIKRKQASTSKGNVVVVTSQEVDIPNGTQFLTTDGEIYESLVLKTAITQTFLITSLERVNNFAIVTLENYNLGNGMILNITGANETGFNGNQTIEVLSKDTFRYANAGVDEIATGTITASFLGARVEVQSLNASSNVNKTFTDNIQLISGVDFVDSSYITFNGIVGGRDIQSLDDFKSAVKEYLGNPENKGNRIQHQIYIKQNTDANFAYFFTSEDDIEIYLTGVLSKVNSSFNFSNFSGGELDDIKGQFIADNQLLLGVDALNLSIINPTFVNINVSVTGLLPNTIEMRTAISLTLKEYMSLLPIKFYLSNTNVELSDNKIESIINLVRDPSGNTPTYSSVVVSGAGSLNTNVKKPILGTVTYA